MTSRNGLSIDAIEIAAGSRFIPAWRFRPQTPRPATPLILVLHPQGRNAAWREGQLCQTLAAQGFEVCAADVSGIGDLAPAFGSGAPHYAREHQDDESYAWSFLILGRTLAGERVTDILSLIRALKTGETHSGRKIGIAAAGKMTVPALLAAALDTSIQQLYLSGGLVSFGSVLETENYHCDFANCIPDILLHEDLPGLAAGMTHARIELAGSIDGIGQKASLSSVRQTYQQAIANGRVSIREAEDWNASSLAQFFSAGSAA